MVLQKSAPVINRVFVEQFHDQWVRIKRPRRRPLYGIVQLLKDEEVGVNCGVEDAYIWVRYDHIREIVPATVTVRIQVGQPAWWVRQLERWLSHRVPGRQELPAINAGVLTAVNATDLK